MAGQYIHIQCDEYALLTDIAHIEQVITATDRDHKAREIEWQGRMLPCMDLTEVLTGHKRAGNRHCIIMKDQEQGERFMAVEVGRVSNIQRIDEDEFEELPNLDFPFNNYFDKAYIDKKDKHCIYRLRNLFDVMKTQ